MRYVALVGIITILVLAIIVVWLPNLFSETPINSRPGQNNIAEDKRGEAVSLCKQIIHSDFGRDFERKRCIGVVSRNISLCQKNVGCILDIVTSEALNKRDPDVCNHPIFQKYPILSELNVRDYCFLELAFQLKDVSACDGIKNETFKITCKAVLNNDSSICEKLQTDSYFEHQCKMLTAGVQGKVSFCRNLSWNYTATYHKVHCYVTVAELSGDYSACKKLPQDPHYEELFIKERDVEDCYNVVRWKKAQLKGNADLCGQITRSAPKLLCKAMISADVSFCENENLDSRERDVCIREVAMEKANAIWVKSGPWNLKPSISEIGFIYSSLEDAFT